jgi:maltooligosyltrehalose trehalohydrolase
MHDPSFHRRFPIGAEPCAAGTHFRVWAPRAQRLEVVLEGAAGSDPQEPRNVALTAEPEGYFAGLAPGVDPGTRYRFRLDSQPNLHPDPASRYQPDGCHGPSEVIDPTAFSWHDDGWRGPRLEGQVLYEMHVGTFTSEGTFAAAARHLAELAELGVTTIEVMPVAEFVGRFGWGYDGVDLFAPTRLYGRPDDFRRFVDAAHGLGLGVILDVVYNHFGPTGNYSGVFSDHYVSERHHTDWGAAINFDGPHSAPVREFFTANAGHWIEEYHLDGLRIDAIHAIVDDSPEHILAAVCRRVRQAARGRNTLVVGENEVQDARMIRTAAEGGCGLDAAWNDDFHHAAQVALTGHNEFYYADFLGSPQELISAVKWGYLYQGQWDYRQERRRGTPAWDIPARRFVIFLQNHDQVANSADGLRMPALTSPGRYRAMTALMFLAPGTPMLFQGQEFAASSPFLFFADHEAAIAKLVRHGREEFLRRFASLRGAGAPRSFADPGASATFERSKLDHAERQQHADVYNLHRDLIRLRREDPLFASQRADRIHGAVIGAEAFLLRYFAAPGDDRLLIVNLGRDLIYSPAAEPLVAPPPHTDWTLLWSSEDSRYGGSGTGLLCAAEWRIPGHAAVVLRPESARPAISAKPT